MAYKILNTLPEFTKKARIDLDALGEADYLNLKQDELAARVNKYDILVVGLGLIINKAIIDKAKKIKIIATATTGLDHIDVKYARKKGIEILSLRGENEFLDTITSTAELAFGLLIDLSRRISIGFESVKNYIWDREKFRGHSLYGKTLGIVGLGRLGKWLARYGAAFNMKVIAYDPKVNQEIFKKLHCQKVDFKTLVKTSDFISIHVHLDSETENMFNRSIFNKMKPSAYLINTSRGRIVNEADLLKALKNKKIAGYATDVLADELEFASKVFSTHPLVEYAKSHNNLIIVPHLGGMTYESREATDMFITKKIVKFLKNNK
jgi:D-3-phosphoglycerate dehydrogenase / 2-oxoglutarate reductase